MIRLADPWGLLSVTLRNRWSAIYLHLMRLSRVNFPILTIITLNYRLIFIRTYVEHVEMCVCVSFNRFYWISFILFSFERWKAENTGTKLWEYASWNLCILFKNFLIYILYTFAITLFCFFFYCKKSKKKY